MISFRKNTLVLALALLVGNASPAQDLPQVLDSLDAILSQKETYRDILSMKMEEYRLLLNSSEDHEDRYRYNDLLFDEFISVNLDSAARYALKCMEVAGEPEGTEVERIEAQLHLAEAYFNIGMYKEAYDLAALDAVPDTLAAYYFHVRKTLCDRMASFAITPADKLKYQNEAAVFREERLKALGPRGYAYHSVLAEKLIDEGQLKEAQYVILSDYHNAGHDFRLCAYYNYTLARIAREEGKDDDCARFLALSAIGDVKKVCLDNVSLRELSVLLYKKGDIDRAYRYLMISLNDALSYNSRQRIVEVNEVFSIINDAYLLKREQQEANLRQQLLLIVILTLSLGAVAVYLFVQMRKLAEARKQLRDANEHLESLNASLVTANSKLKAAISQLKETSMIKDEYIARYMDQCSSYMEKFEEYRKHLSRLVKIDNRKELIEAIEKYQDSDAELKAFYDSFDETFLNLFPSFIEEFNELIQEDKREYPSKAGTLTTEMRIYALVRLGISDSVKIAHFLRYSVTTIYNYRSRTRIKAIADGVDFEKLVTKIGRNSEI